MVYDVSLLYLKMFSYSFTNSLLQPDPIEDDDDDLDDGDDWTAYEIDRLDSGLSGLHRRLIRGWVGVGLHGYVASVLLIN